MSDAAPACPWSNGLPWLAEFAPAMAGVAPRGDGPSLAPAVVVRRLGPRQRLAQEAGMGEALGADLLHVAVNELVAQHALPQVVSVSLAGSPDGGFAVDVFAGIVRACRAHGLALHVPFAVPAEVVGVALTTFGAVVPAPAHCPRPGDVVVGLRGSGPGDGDLAPLLAEASRREQRLQDRLPNGDTLARTLAAARASHLSVLHDPVRLCWPFLGCAIGDGPLTARLRAALPADLDIAFDCRDWVPPAPFAEWFAGDAMPAAATRTSLGCGLVLVVAVDAAARWLDHLAAWGEPGAVIGRVVAR